MAAVASCLEKRESENCGEELSERVEDKKKVSQFIDFCFSFFFKKSNKQEWNLWRKSKESIKRFRGCDLNFN